VARGPAGALSRHAGNIPQPPAEPFATRAIFGPIQSAFWNTRGSDIAQSMAKGAMMLRQGHTLDSFAANSSNREGVSIETIETGATLIVKTRHSYYRMVVVDGSQQLVQIQGGVFPEPTMVRLCGATAGGSAVKVGWILVGLRMECRLGTRCITSSSVHSISIEPATLEESGHKRVA
jgi:hypothetical protein